MKRDLTRAIRAVLSFSIPAMAIAAILVLPASANPVLQITELSGTELTVTLDGVSFGTVTNIGPDHWEWRSGLWGNVQGASGDANDVEMAFYKNLLGGIWAEPGDSAKVNFVGFAWGATDGLLSDIGLDIYSDVNLSDTLDIHGKGGVPDSKVGITNYYGAIWNVAGLFGPCDVFFSDKVDAAKVPDSSPTFVLLAIAAVVIAPLAKRRK